MVMTDEELDEVLQEVAPLHQRAFRAALYSLRELGTRPPVDLWEYKVRPAAGWYKMRSSRRLTSENAKWAKSEILRTTGAQSPESAPSFVLLVSESKTGSTCDCSTTPVF